MKFSYSLIKKLVPQAPAKAKLAEALNAYSFETENLDGETFDISLASNRYSDAASHLGIAREVGAGLKLKLKNPVKEIINTPTNQGFLEVKIENKNLCPRYAARYFEVKRVGISPFWMQKILKACGLKPINGIVDLMNYVMLEMGQPLHAFDFDKIADRRGLHADKRGKSRRKSASSQRMSALIMVRKAKSGEKIETLDCQKFILDSNDLVIANGDSPRKSASSQRESAILAIAGIKGGANSGVDKDTRRIIVEAANFESVGIFKTSRKLKLTTDASLRFDHGLSPALVEWGLDRATELLVGMGAKLIDSVDIYPRPTGDELIEFDVEAYKRLIGVPVSVVDAKKYFRALGFTIETRDQEAQKSSFLVRIPSWRTDIECFEDLAEEISRLSGYGKLQPQAPAIGLKPAAEENMIILKDRIRDLLSSFHLDEVYNYSFVGSADTKCSGIHVASLVELENPISQDLRYLLPDLEGGLLKNIDFNSRFFDTIKIFEIGKIFTLINAERTQTNAEKSQRKSALSPRTSALVEEKLHLGIALSAKKEPLILELKGIADEILEGLGITDVSFVESGGSLRIESDHQVIAVLKLVHLEKGRTASVAEFDLEKLLPLIEEEREFKALPKYPAVIRDISLLVESDVRVGEILEAIQKVSPTLIEDIDLIDEYQDEKLGGKQSLTFRVVFQAEDRTLTDGEVNKKTEKIRRALKGKFRAEIR